MFLYLILFLTGINLEKYVPELLIVYCPNKYKTQRIYDEADADCLAAVKFIPDWFVTSKMIKNLFTALYTYDNILYFNEDSGNAVFSRNGMGILNIYLNNVNLDDIDYNQDDPETIIYIRLLDCHIKFKKRKALKKELNEKLMSIA